MAVIIDIRRQLLNTKHKKLSLNSFLFRFVASIVVGYCFTSSLRINCSLRYNTRHNAVSDAVTYRALHSRPQGDGIKYSTHKPNDKNMTLTKPNIQLLFVGIMTSEVNLETRAKAIFRTWASSIPGDVMFFVGKLAHPYTGSLPVIVLDDVDDRSYPPQKKMFRMLQYIQQNYGDSYRFFMRGDDDLYVKGDRIAALLNSIDSSKLHYIGQCGEGEAQEIGSLGLDAGKRPYCIGGPGVILSRVTLRLLVPYINSCRRKTVSIHEDTELGRCINICLGLTCTQAYQWKDWLYQNFRDKKGSFRHELGGPERAAITLHPVKNPSQMHRLHVFLTTEKILSLKKKISRLENEIEALASSPVIFPTSSPVKVPTSGDKSQVWSLNNFFNAYYYSYECENVRRGIRWEVDIAQVDETTKKLKMSFRDPYADTIGKRIGGYQRVVPNIGVNELLIFAAKSKVKPMPWIHEFMTHSEAKFIFNQKQLFQDVDVSRFKWLREKLPRTASVINIIVPLFGRNDMLKTFVENYMDIKTNHIEIDMTLLVLLYNDKEFEKNNKLLKSVTNENPESGITIITEHPTEFNRGSSLHEGTTYFDNDSLMLFMDIDMAFTADFLRRVQLNTVRGHQVFFPVYYTLYNPEYVCGLNGTSYCWVTPFNFSTETGIWRPFGFGMVGIYKGDYVKSGGFDKTIIGWGQEDVDFNDKVIKAELGVFRAPDTGLVHKYHPKQCTKSLDDKKYHMCIDSKAYLEASQKSLAEIARAAILKSDGTFDSNIKKHK